MYIMTSPLLRKSGAGMLIFMYEMSKCQITIPNKNEHIHSLSRSGTQQNF